MALVYEIPLTPTPQRFNIQLGNATYLLTFKWNQPNLSWILDIADSNEIPLIQGIPVIPGVNLLAQYAYLNFGGGLAVQTDGDQLGVPTFNNLGINSHVLFVVSNG